MASSSSIEVTHLGGGTSVTGSCHLLRANGLNILVDCGAVQGSDAAVPMEEWAVPPRGLDYVFVTHAHIDHIGRIPELIQKGFRGEIIATEPTKTLLLPMLRDAMALSHLPRAEIDKLSQTIDDLSWSFETGTSFDLKNNVRFSLGCAGHILGSCFIRFESRDPPWSVLFSGDLGARDTPILPDPDPPGPCDLLVLESTYGDSLHDDRTRRTERLGAILARCLTDRGKVFIPAFALGRTQEILYELDRLSTDPTLRQKFPDLKLHKIPVFIDSPLGLEITKIYSGLAHYWDTEAKELLRAGDKPMDFKELYAVRKYSDHAAVLEMKGPAVIIAGSGMCSGGRIVDHLRTGLQDKRNDLLFVGYQARGTPGRAILEQAGREGGSVMLDGERCAIKARVHKMSGYSAHADQKGLLEWVGSMPVKPKKVTLVHGEAPARKALGAKLRGLGVACENA